MPIRGVHGVTLLLEDASPTAAVLTDVLGFNKVGQEEALIRFRASEQVIPDALQKAKKWATLVEVADSSSLNYRGAAVRRFPFLAPSGHRVDADGCPREPPINVRPRG